MRVDSGLNWVVTICPVVRFGVEQTGLVHRMCVECERKRGLEGKFNLRN